MIPYMILCVLLTEAIGATLSSTIPFNSRVVSIRSSGMGENKPKLSPNPLPKIEFSPPHGTYFGAPGRPIDPNTSYSSKPNGIILPGVPAGPNEFLPGNAKQPESIEHISFLGLPGNQGMPTDPNASINSRPQGDPDFLGQSWYPGYKGPQKGHGQPTNPNASINSKPADGPVFPQDPFHGFPGSPIRHGMPSDPNAQRTRKIKRAVRLHGQPTDPNASRHSLPQTGPESSGGSVYSDYPGPRPHGMPTDPNASINSRPQETFPSVPMNHGYLPGNHGMPTDPDASKNSRW